MPCGLGQGVAQLKQQAVPDSSGGRGEIYCRGDGA